MTPCCSKGLVRVWGWHSFSIMRYCPIAHPVCTSGSHGEGTFYRCSLPLGTVWTVIWASDEVAPCVLLCVSLINAHCKLQGLNNFSQPPWLFRILPLWNGCSYPLFLLCYIHVYHFSADFYLISMVIAYQKCLVLSYWSLMVMFDNLHVVNFGVKLTFCDVWWLFVYFLKLKVVFISL